MSDPRPPHKAKAWSNIWTKYDPKCLKTRQTQQFCGHVVVFVVVVVDHIFALHVGVGVSK